MLQSISRELRRGGYRLASARSLKPKHVNFLVNRWQAKELTAGTIKNRMGAVRWWADKVNKASVIPRDNSALGIPDRQKDGSNKAQRLDLKKMQGIKCGRMRMSMRLMAAFGLRIEEALKFRPAVADKGDAIALQASWAKGGRAREIPILNDRQRGLLDEARKLVGDGSMIPDDKSYIAHRKAFEHQTLKAGFSNLHGLRHNYAQWRYKSLTGLPCPKAGGLKEKVMNAMQREIDGAARLTISHELGHGRIDITRDYLG